MCKQKDPKSEGIGWAANVVFVVEMLCSLFRFTVHCPCFREVNFIECDKRFIVAVRPPFQE